MPAGGIFISHSSKDAKAANTICGALEARGLACWIAPRDIRFDFQSEIVEAIRHTKVMIIVFSSNATGSDAIRRELALAGKYKAVIIPVRLEDVLPDAGFEYELINRQWVDLFADWETSINRLAELARAVGAIPLEAPAPVVNQPVPVPPPLPAELRTDPPPQPVYRPQPAPAPVYQAPPQQPQPAWLAPGTGTPPVYTTTPRTPRESLMHLLFSWQGRTNRARALLFMAGSFGVFFAAAVLAEAVAKSSSDAGESSSAITGALVLILFPTMLFLFVCQLAVAAKRMHDRNLPTQRIAYFYGPFIAAWLLSAASPQLTAVIVLASFVWSIVEVYVLPGTVGDNPYGPDPVTHRP